ncbi:MAG: hypothetical protein K6E91_00630 [Butyrivibrio sp.]|nr:hypothetical protein [Butyrivibrio sp.]
MSNIIIDRINLYMCDVDFNLVFDDRLTLVLGDSEIGKSIMYKAFRYKSAEDDRIECFDGIDLKKNDFSEVIKN